MYYVYKITDLRKNDIIYIGKTKDFNKRRSHHFTDDKSHVDKYMLNEGRDFFKMEIIQDCIETDDEAVQIEDKYIVEINPIMNKQRSGNIYKNDPDSYMREYQSKYQKSEKRKEYKKAYREAHYQEYLAYQKAYREKKKLEKFTQ